MDLEQTCWEGPPPEGMQSEIIQIGLVEVNTLSLEITRKARRYVRPPKSTVSPFRTELTGITQRQVNCQGHSLADVLNSVTNTFGPRNKTCFTWGDDGDALATEIVGEYGVPHHFNFMNLGHLFQITMGHKHAMSLQAALESLGLAFQGRPHDALVDAENTALLHVEMIRRMRGLAVHKPCGNCGWCLDCLREERSRSTA